VAPVGGGNQLRGHADAIARSPHAAFKNSGDPADTLPHAARAKRLENLPGLSPADSGIREYS